MTRCKMPAMCLIPLLILTLFSGCSLLDDSSESGDGSGTEVLGHGYDVFDAYANPEKVKDPILNMESLQKDGHVTTQVIETGEFTSSWGTTLSEYSSKFNIKTRMEGEYSYYSGAMEAAFSTNRFESTEYHFATVHSDIKKQALLISSRTDPEFLKNYLTPAFRTALENPEDNGFEIFQTYGTHLLTGIILGARLDYNLSARKKSGSGSESIEAYAKASYKSLFASASIEVSSGSETNWNEYYENTEVKTVVIGGRSEYGQNIQNDNDYQDWINSINDNPVFSNVYENGIMPVWDLAPNEEKKAQLKAAFDQWATEKSLNITPVSPAGTCIIDIRVETSDRGSILDHDGRKYYKVNQDLNEDADGDYIYFYVCYGMSSRTADPRPVKNIAVVYDGDKADAVNDCADNYERIDVDLNKGASGDYMYLCLNRTDEGDPVTNIYVLNASDGNEKHYPHGHSKEDLSYTETDRMEGKRWVGPRADLNQQAGGDYLYLYWSKDRFD